MIKSSLKQYSREAAVLAALFLLIIIFSMIEPVYLTPSNMIDIIKQGTINGILAIGITFAIISGGIDLSIGCTFAIVIVTVGQLTVEKVPTLIALSAGAILGGIMGSLNGLLITKLKLQPFIATLGTMSVYRGLAYVFTGGWPVLGIPDTYRKTFTTKLFWDIPVSILVLFAIAILTHIVLSKTRFGNYLYAVGGNEEASKLSGVE